MARAGSIWVEGDDLHYIDAFDAEQVIEGTSVGGTGGTGRPGSLWVESGQIHWINADDDEEFRTNEGVKTAGSRRAGSIWITTFSLLSVAENGDIRERLPSCASEYELTSATGSVITDACDGAGDCVGSGGQTRVAWEPVEVCAAEHLKLELSINGGGYSTKCDDAPACDACDESPFTHTLSGPLAVYSSSASCGAACDLSCVAQYYTWRVTHEDDVGHVLCSQITAANTSTYYTCECSDCSSGGGNGA